MLIRPQDYSRENSLLENFGDDILCDDLDRLLDKHSTQSSNTGFAQNFRTSRTPSTMRPIRMTGGACKIQAAQSTY